MKKYLLVSLTVFFAAVFLWADDAAPTEPKFDIKGEGQVEWGVDFGSGNGTAEERGQMHGFKNTATWEVKFPLLKKTTKTSAKADEAVVYGEVVIKDIELGLKSTHENEGKFNVDGKVGGLEAKFVFHKAYLKVYNAPSFKTNYANLWDPIEKKDYDGKAFKFEPGFNGAGVTLGYADKNLLDLDVAVKFGSNGPWDAKGKEQETSFVNNKYVSKADTKVPEGQVWYEYDGSRTLTEGNTATVGKYYAVFKTTKAKPALHSKYGIGFDFSMKPMGDMLGVKFSLNSTFEAAKHYDPTREGYSGSKDRYRHYREKIVFGFGTELTSKPIAGLSLKLGFDGGSAFAGKKDKNNVQTYGFGWDLLFDAAYKWVGGGMYVGSAGTPYYGWNAKTTKFEEQATGDMALYLKFETKGSKKDDGTFEDSYLLENLDAGAYLGMYRLVSYSNRADNSKEQLPMLFKLWGSYKYNPNDSMYIKPFAHFWAETNHHKDATSRPAKMRDNRYLGVAYDLGVTYSPVEKVEITAKWAHGKVGKDSHHSVISAPANYQNHNGTLTLGVKVAY